MAGWYGCTVKERGLMFPKRVLELLLDLHGTVLADLGTKHQRY